jgi:predicted Zn-dependent peptidase
MEEFYVRTLKNGLRLIHRPLKNTVSHFGLMIHAGSRDELEDEQGLAHFIEHTIFKGTEKRKAFHVLSRLDAVGGELNAYTSKEETAVYGSFLNTYYPRAIELIADIFLNSTFPEKEIEKEKAVIIDEILSYQDSPSEQIFDDFEDLLFKGHPLGRNILGTEKSVKSFTKTDILRYIKRNYSLNNVVLCSSGKINIDRLERICNEHFGEAKLTEEKNKRGKFEGYQAVKKEEKRNTYQAHYMLGNIAPSTTDKLKTATVLLNNLLGGPGLNSMLNMEIREKSGISYNIESSYLPYADTGVFQIYLGTDKNTLEKGERLIRKTLKKLTDDKLSATKLQAAKKQLVGHFALSQENNTQSMLSLGKSLLLYNKVDSDKEVIQKILDITSEEVLEASNLLLNPATLSSLTYL